MKYFQDKELHNFNKHDRTSCIRSKFWRSLLPEYSSAFPILVCDNKDSACQVRTAFRTEKQFMFGSESGSGIMMWRTFVGKKKKKSYYAAVGLIEKNSQEQTSFKCNPQFIVSPLCNFSCRSWSRYHDEQEEVS